MIVVGRDTDLLSLKLAFMSRFKNRQRRKFIDINYLLASKGISIVQSSPFCHERIELTPDDVVNGPSCIIVDFDNLRRTKRH